MNVNQSARIAFCGVITALGGLLMFLTGLVPIGTYALPALAGVLPMAAVIETGPRWAWSVYAAISILSLLIVPDREAVALFILFFGYYPILKAVIERVLSKPLRVVLKLADFNLSMVAEFLIGVYLLGVPREGFLVFGVYLPWVFLLAGNFVFFLYDYAVSLLVVSYCRNFHAVVSKWLHSR